MRLPKIVGILNLSPESFSGDGGMSKSQALAHARRMVQDGADIIDVGAQSTRPGAVQISAEEESRRINGIIRAINQEFPTILVSIDTTRYEVASQAIEEGAGMVNDISGGRFDERLIPSLAGTEVKYVITHSRGSFERLHVKYHYQDVVANLIKYFERRVAYCNQVGLSGEQVVIDPGIGFSKDRDQNIKIINSLERLHMYHRAGYRVPLYIGISRKQFIGRLIGEENPIDRDNATTALHVLCIQKGVDYIRTHNVKNLKECIKTLVPFDLPNWP